MDNSDFAKILARKMKTETPDPNKFYSVDEELKADLSEALDAENLIKLAKRVKGKSFYGAF